MKKWSSKSSKEGTKDLPVHRQGKITRLNLCLCEVVFFVEFIGVKDGFGRGRDGDASIGSHGVEMRCKFGLSALESDESIPYVPCAKTRRSVFCAQSMMSLRDLRENVRQAAQRK